MLDQNGIRLLIRRQLKTANTVIPRIVNLPPDEMIAWENVDFTPPAPSQDAIWLAEHFMWVSEKQKAFGYLELIAIAKYDVNVPVGQGTEKAENLVKLIGTALKAGSGILSNKSPSGEIIQISIIHTAPGKGIRSANGPWYTIPVNTTFRAYGVNS